MVEKHKFQTIYESNDIDVHVYIQGIDEEESPELYRGTQNLLM
jgi:hypothetical protein